MSEQEPTHPPPEGLPLPDPGATAVIQLVRPRFFTRGVSFVLIGLVSLMIMGVSPRVLEEGLTRDNLLAVLVFVVLGGLVIGFKALRRPSRAQTIELAPDHVVLPRSVHSRRRFEVPYEEIRAVFRMEQRDGDVVLIDGGKRLFSFSEPMFEQSYGPRYLWAALLTKIGRLPDGSARLARMRELTRTAYLTGQNPARVTMSLLGIIAMVFVAQLATGALDNPFRMIEMGANAPALVYEGQWFRLITANFLHANWVHIVLNGVGLLFLGTAIERLIGSWRLLLIFLISAVAGAAASTLAAAGPLSVGVSTALFGLLGAFGVLHVKFRADLPPPFRQSVRWWVIILGINGFLPLLIPQIDVAAHAGGFLAGGLVAAALVMPMGRLDPSAASGWTIRTLTVLVSAVFVVAAIQGATHALEPRPEDDEVILAEFMHRADLDGGNTLNVLAWLLVTDPDVSPHRLDLARRAVARATELSPRRAEYVDTLATAHYRLGLEAQTAGDATDHLRRAVDLERDLVAATDHRIFASQLARFLAAHQRLTGPVQFGEVDAKDWNVTWGEPRPARMAVQPPPGWEGPFELYGVVWVGDEIEGLVRVCFGNGAVTDHSLRPPPDFAAPPWPADSALTIGLLDVEAVQCAPGEPVWRAWPMSNQIRGLP